MINRRPASKTAAATTSTPLPPTPPPMPPPSTSAPVGKLGIGMEDDPNFSKLPTRDRDLHRWAEQSQGDVTLDDLDMLLDCLSQADGYIKDQTHPLGDRPLVDVTAGDPPPGPPAMLEKWTPKYEELQTNCCRYRQTASGSSQRTVDISSSSTDRTWWLTRFIKSCQPLGPTPSCSMLQLLGNSDRGQVNLWRNAARSG
jgi:hypothetical protein